MNYQQLSDTILQKKSFLCVGLDTDLSKIPVHLKSEKEPVLSFNKAIIEATREYAVSYKINTAFYEQMGPKGWDLLLETVEMLPTHTFNIADAKRGDIGNTSTMYASAFLDKMPFDAITVSPYMGEDSVRPFMQNPEKWVIILALTSNAGSNDFQKLKLDTGRFLYEEVLETCSKWGSHENTMFVVGATHPEDLAKIRKQLPSHVFLVPGVGAQGGDLEAVIRAGRNEHGGLLINSSRGIIYASSETDFAEAAAASAKKLVSEMSKFF